MSGRQQKTLVQPINAIFRYLQSGQRVSVWLYDNLEFRLEGKIIGFDEFMNVVMDDAEEVWVKQSRKPANDDSDDSKANGAQTSKTKKQYGDRRTLGRLLLKGENITAISPAQKPTAAPAGSYSTQMQE